MISVNIEKKLKVYDGLRVLKINREFKNCSITALYGPSGTGKTTFLKIVAGFIKPEKGLIISGNVKWLDTDVKLSIPPQIRKAGFVFQDYALFPNMTVMEHLSYATSDIIWINRLLAIGKLESLRAHKPVHLSGGQQQRLAILRALAPKPKLLLMDEPFSALDHDMKAVLLDELKVVFDELKLTVLIVSHNPQELTGLCTSALEINTA